jgi:hypothetical protein
MPTGTPKLQGRIDAIMEEHEGAREVGTIKPEVLAPTPRNMDFTEPPPPWELVQGSALAQSDARNFVDVPESWELRWINPRVLDQVGWRYWQPIMASDPNVKVKVPTMVSPEGNIRRGGHGGDILAWMYKSWVESRRKELMKRSAQIKQSSVDRTAGLKEEFRRGTYGPNISVTEAKHPSHTMAEGKSMTDQ